MKPVSPVIPGSNFREVVFAKNQPEYIPLPAVVESNGQITTRWKLTLRERLQLLFKGSLWVQVLTGHAQLQPLILLTEAPEIIPFMEIGPPPKRESGLWLYAMLGVVFLIVIILRICLLQ